MAAWALSRRRLAAIVSFRLGGPTACRRSAKWAWAWLDSRCGRSPGRPGRPPDPGLAVGAGVDRPRRPRPDALAERSAPTWSSSRTLLAPAQPAGRRRRGRAAPGPPGGAAPSRPALAAGPLRRLPPPPDDPAWLHVTINDLQPPPAGRPGHRGDDHLQRLRRSHPPAGRPAGDAGRARRGRRRAAAAAADAGHPPQKCPGRAGAGRGAGRGLLAARAGRGGLRAELDRLLAGAPRAGPPGPGRPGSPSPTASSTPTPPATRSRCPRPGRGSATRPSRPPSTAGPSPSAPTRWPTSWPRCGFRWFRADDPGAARRLAARHPTRPARPQWAHRRRPLRPGRPPGPLDRLSPSRDRRRAGPLGDRPPDPARSSSAAGPAWRRAGRRPRPADRLPAARRGRRSAFVSARSSPASPACRRSPSTIAGLVGACIFLPPAIVAGYAVKAAEREDREAGGSRPRGVRPRRYMR